MKNIADMEHCSIIDTICPYEHSCSMCRLHSDYETAKEKAKKLVMDGQNDNVYITCQAARRLTDEEVISYKETCEWIPCSERLPEENGYYLCKTHYLEIMICKYCWNIPNTKKKFFRGCCAVNVIAWMPLPELYKIQETT